MRGKSSAVSEGGSYSITNNYGGWIPSSAEPGEYLELGSVRANQIETESGKLVPFIIGGTGTRLITTFVMPAENIIIS